MANASAGNGDRLDETDMKYLEIHDLPPLPRWRPPDRSAERAGLPHEHDVPGDRAHGQYHRSARWPHQLQLRCRQPADRREERAGLFDHLPLRPVDGGNAASIKEFGFRQPIMVDEESVIIVGHTRYKAALKLGLEKVPVHVATGLTPAQAKAYRLADNQTAALSRWDDDKLPLELIELQGLGFDLDLTGFSSDDLLRLIQADATQGQIDPDAIPEPPDEATTQPGDLWILGKHRLLCGDAGKPEDVDRL
jgi:hypothetical protein